MAEEVKVDETQNFATDDEGKAAEEGAAEQAETPAPEDEETAE